MDPHPRDVDPGVTGALAFYDTELPDRVGIYADMPIIDGDVNPHRLDEIIATVLSQHRLYRARSPAPKGRRQQCLAVRRRLHYRVRRGQNGRHSAGFGDTRRMEEGARFEEVVPMAKSPPAPGRWNYSRTVMHTLPARKTTTAPGGGANVSVVRRNQDGRAAMSSDIPLARTKLRIAIVLFPDMDKELKVTFCSRLSVS